MKHPANNSSRIESVDALRGFAVMAIVLVHNLEHFIYPVYPTDAPAWLGTLDRIVLDGTFSLFAGKAYAIFALLFGLTFFLQNDRQKREGKDFGWRFLWRMLMLAVFATLNAAFFPAGDVLMLFAVVSIVLLITRNWSDRTIFITAVIFLLQPVEWFHCIAALINPGHTLPDLHVAEMYAEAAEYTKAGEPGAFFLGNITLGQKASLLWAVNAGRFVQTAGLFLLGHWLGRKWMFSDNGGERDNTRTWTIILATAAIAFAPLYTLKELAMQTQGTAAQSAGTALDMWQKLAFTLVLASAFVLSYRLSGRFRKSVSGLCWYGRMSLTNYIFQSVTGALIYFPIGLNLAPYCGYTVSLLIGIAVFLLQVLLSRWWLSRHRQGPLETLWHKWTWMQFKRAA